MKRSIQKIAVLGSGIMGSRIACHFANIGCEVLLLDIAPNALSEEEQKKGLSLDAIAVKNRMVQDSLQNALKSNPSPIYKADFAKRIKTGNFQDDMPKIADCDWIIEVLVERLDIKKQIFDQVEKYRKAGTLITSNTSGIPIHLMAEGRSEDFQAHFCGTHFFNPPRYLPLLEIIPTAKTKQEVVDFLLAYGNKFLGKTTVLCKDTPAFIANRVGVYAIMALFHVVEKMGLTVEEVDKLTGTVLGRPKSATFRTCDVVGLDTLIHVANGVRENCPKDERLSDFVLPSFVQKLAENKWLGDKTGQGFYKKVKQADGKSDILSLDLKTLDYKTQEKVKFASLEAAKNIDNLAERLLMLTASKDKAGDFYRAIFAQLFAYVSNRIPEIADDIYKIDQAMKAGFGWEMGPFETWQAVGIDAGLTWIKEAGLQVAPWVEELAKAQKTFYSLENTKRTYYAMDKKEQTPIPNLPLNLTDLRGTKTVFKNADVSIIDLGDGVLNLEFHTKMNTIGSGVLQGIHKAIDLAEKEYKGLVVSNEGGNFSAGANIGMIFMLAAEQNWDELDFAVRAFQEAMMRVRYSSIPVVAAPHNMALGGGCELCMHADKVVAHAELYMGLVEFGVGLIPAGGGSKEFALRLSDELKEGDVRINRFRERFLTIGQAKVSTSAYEAFDLGYLRKGVDEVVVSRALQLARAKSACLELAENGYTKPAMRKDITVLGQEGLGIVYVGANSMQAGNYISVHDQLISEKFGFVLAGGDLSLPTQVSEQYLLNLERKAFVELCMQKKTLERIQSLLNSGKILRN
jgi:3-hydroxyacyl-CoA dehydrogenase